MFNSIFVIQWTLLDPSFEKFNCVQKNDNKTAVKLNYEAVFKVRIS